jgi:thiol:disulfide interchange protein
MAAPSIHPLQKLLDNPWVLLALGVLLPVVSYTLWGLFELQNLPPAKLP